MASSRVTYGVNALLDKMKSSDADYRFMALTDLISEAKKDTFLLDDHLENRTVDQVLQMMEDKNGEVKNLAVKCLGILVKQLREKQMQVIIDRLIVYTSSKDEELRDIASLGLKTVISEIPPTSPLAVTACNKLAPKLLAQVQHDASPQDLLIESLDVLAEVLSRFSGTVVQLPQLQAAALDTFIGILGHSRAAVRKRGLTALGALATASSSDIFTRLAAQTSSDLASGSLERQRTAIQLIGGLARTAPRRTGRRLPEFMPKVLAAAEMEDDELREYSLQTMEAILLKCPTEVTPFINATLAISTRLLKYDPNYAIDVDGGEEDVDMEEDEEEDDDDLADDYSDDDDVSWKVRRSAAKVISAAVATRPELLSTFYQSVAPSLLSRFGEREESVRLEVLQTFAALLKQTYVYGGSAETEMTGHINALKRKRAMETTTMEVEDSPVNLLRQQGSTIAKATLRQLSSKSNTTRQACFVILKNLVLVVRGGLEAHMADVVARVEQSMKATDSRGSVNSTLKIEILGFLRLLFQSHPPRSFQDHLGRLVPLIIRTLDDKFHKEASEAFSVCSQLVRVLRPVGPPTSRPASYKPYIVQIYDATIQRLKRPDTDQEVKERGIACLGDLLAYAGDELVESYNVCLPFLLDRLKNEVTRYTTVKVVAEVVKTPIHQGPAFEAFVQECLAEIAGLLRKSNRQLKIAVFDALRALLKRSGSNLSPATSKQIIAELQPMISEGDLHLLPAALNVPAMIISNEPSSISDVETRLLPASYTLVQSPLIQGPALDALLNFFHAVVTAKPAIASQVIYSLMESVETAKGTAARNTQAYTTVARSVGAILEAVPEIVDPVIDDMAKVMKARKGSQAQVFLSLLVLGEIGRFHDFAGREDLFEGALDLYDADSEEVKSAAAFTVGNMAVGSLDKYLPVILEQVRSDDRKRYLSLHAIKEVITHCSPEALESVADTIWVPLFDNSEAQEEGTRNIGSECLGRLTLSNPSKYLVQLQERLQSPSAMMRATVIAAVRYTLTEASSSYDELLAPLIVEFLSLMRDEDLDVRRHALASLNSAAKNKPHLIRDHLPTLLPLLYKETEVKKELVHIVEMGPFKIEVDDGLDLRKSAFETMYTLLDTCLSKIDVHEFLSRVSQGLKDDDGIKILSHICLVRLAAVAPTAVAQRLDEMSDAFATSLKKAPKDTATKQEVARHAELQRSVYRAIFVLSKLSSPTTTPVFAKLVRETKAADKSGLYAEIEAAQASGQSGVLFVAGNDGMDVDA